MWHAGEDAGDAVGGVPRWAAPDLDESEWKPFTAWKLNPAEPRLWIRCHVDSAAFRESAHPAVQASLRAAYELFYNGRLIGGFGDMRSGNFTADSVRTFPLPLPVPAKAESTIALHLLLRAPLRWQFNLVGLRNAGRDAELAVGEEGWLEARRDSWALAQGLRTTPVTIAFGVVGVAGFMLFGLYLNDRSRLAFLFLAVHCWALAMRRLLEQAEASFFPVSIVQYQLLDGLLLTIFPSLVLVGCALVRKPLPRFYRIAIGLLVTLALEEASRSLLSASLNMRLIPVGSFIVLLVNLIWVVLYLSPFTAFWPWRRISGSMRYAATVLMVWSVVNEIYIALLLSRNLSVRFAASIDDAWLPLILEMRAFLTMGAVVVLLVILFRDQRKTAEVRAQLAGEMEAAREVQQQLVPASIPRVAGFEIEAAYLPAAEVGGDFYQVLPLADGSTLIAVGDVSGKGLKAAMTGALAIGALRTLAAEDLSPNELLTRLNRQIVGARNGGFITCLCLRVGRDGAVSFANAGHIPPYLDGCEVGLDSSLPLGLNPSAEYSQTRVTLVSGDRLTLLTDGVLEATDPATKELFGFDRTAELSTQSAEKIAATAQAWGQDDDITVLTVLRA